MKSQPNSVSSATSPVTVAPYGSWQSPITSERMVSAAIGLGELRTDEGELYWTESRPLEGGRVVLVHRSAAGNPEDVTPIGFNVRTRVHEYGGGAFTVHGGGVYFSNFADNQLYLQRRQGWSEGSNDEGSTGYSHPQAVTAEPGMRFADMVVDATRQRLICVREDHTQLGQEAVNTLVSVPLSAAMNQDASSPQGHDNATLLPSRVLIQGHDFYSNPRLSPDGNRLAYLAWNHPNMPWDGCELWVADVAEDGTVMPSVRVAGGPEESIFQPEWSPNGELYFVSDRTNWWNLYRFTGSEVQPVLPRSAEFGLPQWVFGQSTYTFLSERELVCTFHENGAWKLAELNLATSQLDLIESPYTFFDGLRTLLTSGDGKAQVVLRAGSATEFTSFVAWDRSTRHWEVLQNSNSLAVDVGYLSIPLSVEFPTAEGRTAYAFYYPPKNKDFSGPEGEKPPLLVQSHGGPTAAAEANLNLAVQYWTSRGFAVLDVNYGGSTGYGRAYRDRLRGNWGLVDVADCENGAKYIAAQGFADSKRLAIEGGSAGGYTTLSALTFTNTFSAGASHFGVSDVEALAKETHKFESRYLDGLIGPYPASRAVYVERSPIHFTEQLNCPVIFFQGLDDKVVPPQQAERMVAALQNKGLPVAYVAFAGEGHGFRIAENIRRSLDGTLYFFAQVFGFQPADEIEPIAILNLE